MALLENNNLLRNARCEVTAWGMNPAAICATALFTPYWSCAEYALCIHEFKVRIKIQTTSNICTPTLFVPVTGSLRRF